MRIENIKFKAKSLCSGKWVIGDLFHEPHGVVCIVQHTDDTDRFVTVDPSTVCQFTGMKDCKDKEVWEGDIIRNPEFPFEKRTVTWNEIGSSFMLIDKDE